VLGPSCLPLPEFESGPTARGERSTRRAAKSISHGSLHKVPTGEKQTPSDPKFLLSHHYFFIEIFVRFTNLSNSRWQSNQTVVALITLTTISCRPQVSSTFRQAESLTSSSALGQSKRFDLLRHNHSIRNFFFLLRPSSVVCFPITLPRPLSGLWFTSCSHHSRRSLTLETCGTFHRAFSRAYKQPPSSTSFYSQRGQWKHERFSQFVSTTTMAADTASLAEGDRAAVMMVSHSRLRSCTSSSASTHGASLTPVYTTSATSTAITSCITPPRALQ
jgi:hypothetical protein